MSFVAQIFRDSSNVIRLLIKAYDPSIKTATPISWAGVTRAVVHLLTIPSAMTAAEIIATADTDINSTLIDYSVDGEIKLKFGSLKTLAEGDIPKGDYNIRLKVYDGVTPTVVIHEATHLVRLKYLNTDIVSD